MAQLCTNAPPITNSALNGSHLHQCLLTHLECTQPTQMKCSPYTLRMHSTSSNQVLYESNVHKYTLMTQMKTYNARMCTHAHPMLRNTSKEHQSSTCTPPNSRWRPKPQSSSKALQNSSKAPKAPPRTLQNWNLHLQQTQNLKISLNAHKQSNL